MFHPVGGLVPPPGKAVGPPPPFSPGAGRPVGLDPSRRLPLLPGTVLPGSGWRLLLAFQLCDPGLQNLDMSKEPTNQLNQLLAGEPGQILRQTHAFSLPAHYLPPFVGSARNKPSLNSYRKANGLTSNTDTAAAQLDTEPFRNELPHHLPIPVGQFDARLLRQLLHRCLQLRLLRLTKGGTTGLLEYQGCRPSLAEGGGPPANCVGVSVPAPPPSLLPSSPVPAARWRTTAPDPWALAPESSGGASPWYPSAIVPEVGPSLSHPSPTPRNSQDQLTRFSPLIYPMPLRISPWLWFRRRKPPVVRRTWRRILSPTFSSRAMHWLRRGCYPGVCGLNRLGRASGQSRRAP